jgi:hypothetical protein
MSNAMFIEAKPGTLPDSLTTMYVISSFNHWLSLTTS